MLAGLKSRVSGFRGGASPLDGELKAVTGSGVIDIPKDLLTPVCEASLTGEEARREIMTHLRECLQDSSAKNWRKIYAAMVLVEELVKSGSPALLAETAEGHHFDLVQRLSFLEHFQQTADKRAEKFVRTKASALRKVLVEKLQNASLEDTGEAAKDTMSSCSAGAPSMVSCSTAASSGTSATALSFSSEDCLGRPPTPEKPKGRMILNGIVKVGHSDDTTSEESAGEKAPVRYSEPKRSSRRERDERRHRRRDDSSESDSPSPRNSSRKDKTASAPPPAAQTVDLLDL